MKKTKYYNISTEELKKAEQDLEILLEAKNKELQSLMSFMQKKIQEYQSIKEELDARNET